MAVTGGLALRLPRRRASQPQVQRARITLTDGARTTVWVAEHDPRRTDLRVVVMPRLQPLLHWCHASGVAEALIGGFFVRATGMPLGEVRTAGVLRRHVPFDEPWAGVRACLHVAGGRATIARRHELPDRPRGDLLQAGPLLVRDGEPRIGPRSDPEGFAAGARQFDSDVTAGRHPRAALAITPGRILAVACDGRAPDEAGLTLLELAELLADLGAERAINLDGGGSTSLVSGGELWNRPREQEGDPILWGRPIVTALTFTAR